MATVAGSSTRAIDTKATVDQLIGGFKPGQPSALTRSMRTRLPAGAGIWLRLYTDLRLFRTAAPVPG